MGIPFAIQYKIAKAQVALMKDEEAPVAPPAAAPEPAAEGEPATQPPDPTDNGGPVLERVDFRGITVEIDRPRGFVQEGVGADGTPWARVYHVPYGFIPGTLGGDGEGLDVFLGGDARSTTAFWITQVKSDGTFDEFKVMLGFADQESAKAAYTLHVPKRYFGAITPVNVEHMKAMLGIEPVLTEIVKSLGAPVSGELSTFNVKLSSCAQVRKSISGELRYVLGVVLEPDVPDLQGDVYDAEVVRKTAWDFMVHFRNVGLQHKGLVNGKVHIVDSFVVPVDLQLGGMHVRAGTWILGLHVVDDELWAGVQNGAFTGLSIGGFAAKTKLV